MEWIAIYDLLVVVAGVVTPGAIIHSCSNLIDVRETQIDSLLTLNLDQTSEIYIDFAHRDSSHQIVFLDTPEQRIPLTNEISISPMLCLQVWPFDIFHIRL